MSRMSDTTGTLKTQQEGYQAYLDGLHVRDCPYLDNQELREAWSRGYVAARTDRARENQKAN